MGRIAIGAGMAMAWLLLAPVAPASAQVSPPAGRSPKSTAVPAGPDVVTAKSRGAARPLFRAAYLPTTVQLRSGPGRNSDLVQVIPAGNMVGVAKCSDGWCAVVWKGRRGFAPADTLVLAEPRPDGTYPAYKDEVTAAYHGGAGDNNWPPNFSWEAFVGLGYGPNSHYHNGW